ncbi:O-antigen polymerase [Flammeovirga sp. SJP92]|uniref:O-antigen polymerase n=1 Tax=Flammeovirga sp. SJP92 TaxID=1775430 RepID=UPI000787BF3A|nr:O-antigen polymerase [Flammeovirga sp. SJP92]KXX68574.1 hypothetical protein AVL50_22710 [Flammeovirga sp. SJP92]
MKEILLILYIIIALVLVNFVYKKIKLTNWSIGTYLILWIIVFYYIMPIIMLLSNIINGRTLGVEPYYGLKNINEETYVDFLTLFISSFFTLVFIVSYNLKIKQKKVNEIIYRKIKIFRYKFDIQHILSFCLVLLSLFSMFFYVYGFGGVGKTLSYAKAVRAGILSIDHNYLFLKRFLKFSILPILLFPILYKRNKSKYIFLFFIVSLFTYGLTLKIYESRQNYIDFMLILFLSYYLKNNKALTNGIKLLIFFIIISAPFLIYLVLDGDSKFDNLIADFSFPQLSLFVGLDNSYNYFLFQDILSSPFGNVLPSSLSPFSPTGEIVFLNTYYILGTKESIVPAGIVGWSYYNLSIFGVGIVAFTLGIIFKKIDSFFQELLQSDMNYAYIYSYIILSSVVIIRTGSPRLYLFYPLFITIFLVFFCQARYSDD